eukprot:TRINITY_DN466_c2_g1_i1.p1 TRINITY_DN466_c2_g1~~TRINITY_DN466_c2_g1_i1.p1  ORF type:complete len:1018 (+),score=232.75 TRINITY_DN466_c2_g1_i1:175-3228(+)
MFGSSNPFGQSSSSPFGTQSVFGQTNNASNNPFTPKPFGSTSPFGSQTGSSMFGGTSTGVFGATQSSSPLTSTPAFGASSVPAFGSSTPAFGASSTPAFGTASSSFGGSSVFGQKPAFGGFGSTTTQTSPFGSTFQQTQAAFGSNLFGSSTPFGASNQPAFGATSTPAFGSTSSPAFGATSSPAFGSTSTPTFGSTTAFGVSSAPSFGSSGTQAFAASSNPVFGSSSTSAFGPSSTPAFGQSTAAAFGSSSSSPFGFGQSTPSFGSTPFGTSPSPFGAQSSPFGTQTTTPAFGSPGFGQSAFGGQRGGSRVSAYTPTPEVDGGSGTQPAGKLESISAMPVYKDKSHEELRWEDYQQGDKGGPNPAGQPASGINFAPSTQSNPFGATGTFGQTAPNPFSTSTPANPFSQKTPTFGSPGFGASSTPAFSSPFAASSSTLFGTTSAAPSSIFGSSSAPAFGGTSAPSPFGTSSTPAFGSGPSFGSTPSIFSTSAPATTPAFSSSLNFGNTQSSPLFQSSTPSLGHATSTFGPSPAFGQTAPPFGQTNIFSTPSPPFGGNVFSSNTAPSLLNTNNPPSLSTPFQPSTPAQASGPFAFNSFGQTQPATSTGFGSLSNVFGQSTFGQPAPSQNNTVTLPTPVTNPFGTLPAMPQISIGRAGSSPSIQYGISSMPVADKPTPVRISSLLTSRHLSQRRIRLPARKYHPKNDGPKIPFFSDEEETESTPKADALFIPRENPRALVVRPMEQWPSRTSTEKQSLLRNISTPVHENGKISGDGSAPALNGSVAQDNGRSPAENGLDRSQNVPLQVKPIQKPNGVHNDNPSQKGEDSSSYITISGHRAGEAAIVYEHGAGIEALMPKLRHSDYYTEPRIQELAAKERAEPGFCRHVKDFVIGRHGYGSIRFIDETDVRRLDLESLVQFNNREVIVYMDESKKPPVGQGLNKPAEVTLLNIKCFDKKTGEQYTQGPKVERYKEMLMKKARDQGAEFVSYDPVKGEWKFKVDHFSRYQLGDEEDPLDCTG